LPLYEVIEVDTALERMLHEGGSEADMIAAARKRGAGILLDGVAKMRAGLTTPQEVARAVHEDPSLPEVGT
jgi:general secretion pathway protein E